jgi:Zinc finger, C3HC4 type (RING finger)
MDSMHDMQVRDEEVRNEEARNEVELVSPGKPLSPLRQKTTLHSQRSRGSKTPALVLPFFVAEGPSTVPESPLKKKYKRNSIGAFKVAFADQSNTPFTPKPSDRESKVLGSKKLELQSEVAFKINSMLRKRKQSSEVCAICVSKPANAIYETCMHGGMCADCAVESFKANKKNCSFCRQVATAHQPVKYIFRTEQAEENLMMIVEDITPKPDDFIDEQDNEHASDNESPDLDSQSRDGTPRQVDGRDRGN